MAVTDHHTQGATALNQPTPSYITYVNLQLIGFEYPLFPIQPFLMCMPISQVLQSQHAHSSIHTLRLLHAHSIC